MLNIYLMNLEEEPDVSALEEDGKPEDRVDIALKCLPHYDPIAHVEAGPSSPFRYWKIRDYAHAYRSRRVTPSMVFHNSLLFSWSLFIVINSGSPTELIRVLPLRHCNRLQNK